MKRIVLDLDGVCVEFNQAYARLLIKEDGEDRFPAGWENNPSILCPCWDFDTFFGYSLEVQKLVWEKHILRDKTAFWKNLGPVPGAVAALARLNALAKGGFIELFFLSDRKGYRAKYQTEEWLYHKGGINFPTVILAADKIPLLKDLKAHVFIDDKPKTLEAVHDARLLDFVCYQKMTPYNEHVKLQGIKRVHNLTDMLKDLGLWEDRSE